MMRLTTLAIATILLGTLASAQSDKGTIQGTIRNARGALAGIEVRVKNATTQEIVLVTTTDGGEYSVSVTPGTYEVFATTAAHTSFARRELQVAAGATVRVDGMLTESQNAGTPGELFFLYAASERQAPTGPAPRTHDGRPDLSGMWLPSNDLEPESPPFQPWAAEVAKERATRAAEDPRAWCLPSGVVRTSALDLAKFVQTPNLLVMLIEGSVPGMRQVFLDGRPHPKEPNPTWLGHSIGRWEQDTLVVDTVGFNDKGWIDNQGRPQTEQLHVIERYRRLNLGHLELEITIDDPGAYTKPWKVRRVLRLAPQEEIQEYVCNENHKTEHYVAK